MIYYLCCQTLTLRLSCILLTQISGPVWLAASSRTAYLFNELALLYPLSFRPSIPCSSLKHQFKNRCIMFEEACRRASSASLHIGSAEDSAAFILQYIHTCLPLAICLFLSQNARRTDPNDPPGGTRSFLVLLD